MILVPSLLLLLGHSSLGAAECGVLKLQKSRSLGTSIAQNNCTNDSELSVESILKLPAGGRVWLESTSSLQDSERFQIICQNKSTGPLNIKISGAIYPWLRPENAQCKDWVNDRLECNELKSDKKALFCSIAQIKTPSSLPMGRTTSLALRGLQHKTNQNEVEQWSSYIKPEIDLCRKLFASSHPITLSWKINSSGVASAAEIKEPDIDNNLAECAIEVIENFKFPKVEKDTQVTLSF